MVKGPNKHVVVIGAGIAGLSAASYLLRNGYAVTIVEQHDKPGGLCTSWKRQGYTIDYCVHWLVGTKAGTEFHQMWEELGALTNGDGSPVPIVNAETFSTIGLADGETVEIYSDIEKFRAELLRLGPEDEKQIDKFCKSLHNLSTVSMTALSDEKTLGKRLATLLQMRHIMGHLMPMEDYAKRFSSPRIQQFFNVSIPGDWSLASLTFGLAQQHVKGAGYPVGGSLNLARNMERVVKRLGANLRYGNKVTKIEVTENVAVGVTTEQGETIAADYVISAADGYQTLHNFLGDAYTPQPLQHVYETYPLFPSTVFVALGLDRDCSGLPHASTPYLVPPLELADGSIHTHFSVNVYNYDDTLAPKGKTLVTVLFNTWNSAFWEELVQTDRKQYELTKDGIAKQVIGYLDKMFGDIKEHVDMVDVSTPHSVIRYTGNWKGSFEGFAPTRTTLSKTLPKTLKGLEHFAMIGQWTVPGGGLPTAAQDGRDIAIKLCKQDKRQFTGILPQ
jgi:phytoene dehydrogenase-like protein